MLNRLKKDNKGFTIIEVMIVLAIAGLIILIVFLAVPALQRNSRNTQRKNDISGLLAAVTEYETNNNGSAPTAASQVTALAKMSYYSGNGGGQGQVNLVDGSTAAQAALTASSANDRVVIVTGAHCGAGGATATGPARGVAAQFLTEIAGGNYTPSCQDS